MPACAELLFYIILLCGVGCTGLLPEAEARGLVDVCVLKHSFSGTVLCGQLADLPLNLQNLVQPPASGLPWLIWRRPLFRHLSSVTRPSSMRYAWTNTVACQHNASCVKNMYIQVCSTPKTSQTLYTQPRFGPASVYHSIPCSWHGARIILLTCPSILTGLHLFIHGTTIHAWLTGQLAGTEADKDQ